MQGCSVQGLRWAPGGWDQPTRLSPRPGPPGTREIIWNVPHGPNCSGLCAFQGRPGPKGLPGVAGPGGEPVSACGRHGSLGQPDCVPSAPASPESHSPPIIPVIGGAWLSLGSNALQHFHEATNPVALLTVQCPGVLGGSRQHSGACETCRVRTGGPVPLVPAACPCSAQTPWVPPPEDGPWCPLCRVRVENEGNSGLLPPPSTGLCPLFGRPSLRALRGPTGAR